MKIRNLQAQSRSGIDLLEDNSSKYPVCCYFGEPRCRSPFLKYNLCGQPPVGEVPRDTTCPDPFRDASRLSCDLKWRREGCFQKVEGEMHLTFGVTIYGILTSGLVVS